MTRSPGRYCLVLSLMVLLVVGAGLPAQAEFTKLYRFMNNTASAKGGVRAVTNGMDVITADFVAPTNWGDPTVANILFSGAYCTKLKWEGGEVASGGGPVKVGWSTQDSNCRLRDLRWVTTAGNLAGSVAGVEQIQGAPGGGYSFKANGEWVMVITNDTDGPISLAATEFAVSPTEFGLEYLDYIAEVGLVGLRVQAIILDIDNPEEDPEEPDSLAGKIRKAERDELLPDPSARSLLRKLEKAIGYLQAALGRWEVSDNEGAIVFRDRAAKQITNFISEVTTGRDRGKIREDLADEWVPAAEAIRDAILALPGGEAPQVALDPPSATPMVPGFDPGLYVPGDPLSGDYVPWPVVELPVGCYTAFVIPGVGGEEAFVLHGSIVVPANPEDPEYRYDMVLDWVDQATAALAAPETTPPVIQHATISPEMLWPPDHEMVKMTLDVQVTGAGGPAFWYIKDVLSNQDVLGDGSGDYAPDWDFETEWAAAHPNEPYEGPSLWLRRERAGTEEVRIYTVILGATDTAGNVYELPDGVVPDKDSPEPCDPSVLKVLVDHDEGTTKTAITSLAAVPVRGRAVQITFTLASPGEVQAEVLNIAGRRIKTIVADRKSDKGTTTLVWNCQNERGLAVPAGTYLIRLIARTEDGQQAAALCPVTIRP